MRLLLIFAGLLLALPVLAGSDDSCAELVGMTVADTRISGSGLVADHLDVPPFCQVAG